jgi:peptidoglycan/LPS O-acetylase OafA/YrhL
VAVGGGWTNNPSYESPVPSSPKGTYPIISNQPVGYCDVNFTCQKNFTSANDVYNRNVFVALVILGVLSLIAGFFIRKSVAVSLGLSLGGVVALVVASVRYWSDMNDYLRVAVLAVALIILVIIGLKKVRD